MFIAIVAILIIYIVAQSAWSFYYLNIGGALAKTTFTGSSHLGDTSKPLLNVFITGDSVAAGVGASSFETSVAGRIAQHLAEKYSLNLENFARSGFKMHDVLTATVPETRKDLAIIIAGSNNLFHFSDLDDFRVNTRAVLEKYSAFAEKVILVGPGRIVDSPAVPVVMIPFYKLQSSKYALIMKEIAEKYANVVYINPLEVKIDAKNYGRKTLASDLFHPNDEGARFWFDLIKEKLPN